jgi:hypothetical protein
VRGVTAEVRIDSLTADQAQAHERELVARDAELLPVSPQPRSRP